MFSDNLIDCNNVQCSQVSVYSIWNLPVFTQRVQYFPESQLYKQKINKSPWKLSKINGVIVFFHCAESVWSYLYLACQVSRAAHVSGRSVIHCTLMAVDQPILEQGSTFSPTAKLCQVLPTTTSCSVICCVEAVFCRILQKLKALPPLYSKHLLAQC